MEVGLKRMVLPLVLVAGLHPCFAAEPATTPADLALPDAKPNATQPAPEEAEGKATAAQPAAFEWQQSDYGAAMKLAESQRRMLVVAFLPPGDSSPAAVAVKNAFAAERLQKSLSQVVAIQLAADTQVSIGGEQKWLVGQPAFADLQGQPGLVMIDLRNPSSEHYRRVVSIFPFNSRRTFDATQLQILLTLPEGSLTQRTLVYAVRSHPERPQSALSGWHPVLADETQSHSNHQAAIGVQGHHQFDSRFHRINGRLAQGGACSEVCAESWPGQNMFDAAIECVHSWRQSSGHWSSVSRRHRFFGYDMKRGRNGIWYATGLFSGA